MVSVAPQVDVYSLEGGKVVKGWAQLHPMNLLRFYLTFAIPGIGMWCEAYIVFSQGNIGSFQSTMWPTCFKAPYLNCNMDMVQHVGGYIVICGIIAGMLFWGALMDFIGRRWGGRAAVGIMWTGAVLLVFTPMTTDPGSYYAMYVTVLTWYGFGVGAEYPFASSSASERSAYTSHLRMRRGETVVLVFSNQGLGNFCNTCIILILMAIFTNPKGNEGNPLQTTSGSAQILMIMYAVAAIVLTIANFYRYFLMKESALFSEESSIEAGAISPWRKQVISLYWYWPRQVAACMAWLANDFAFYGNKLQQGKFIALLYPAANSYVKLQWTALNSFVALTGYYVAAKTIDQPWMGRVYMQNMGFIMMFIIFIIIYGQWGNMGGTYYGANTAGAQAFQALYYLSSFFNQFGPNATTWLVAGEIFPTNIRAGYHGFAAAIGKVGAIIAALWISYIPQSPSSTAAPPASDQTSQIFLISAMFGLMGWIVTAIWLPETTGLELEEYDRLQRCALDGRFKDYHGEAVNPKHLSIWEYRLMGWHKSYDPVQDQKDFMAEIKELEAKGGSAAGQVERLLAARGMKSAEDPEPCAVKKGWTSEEA